LDSSDNFATRFALHDACFKGRIPLVSAAVSGFSAQLTVFKAYLGSPHPCYRCFVPAAPEREVTCAQEGILGALAGMMGAWQALETVKELLGIGRSLSGSLLLYDALSNDIRRTQLPRDPGCACCGSTALASSGPCA
jgi:adenylyltransferase/sulfurtransferase